MHLSATRVLVAERVSFSYGRAIVLDGVSLHVDAGEFVALVGPNGSGKSTLLRVLLGLLPPADGSVSLFGHAPANLRDRWRIGYVPQRPAFDAQLPATVEEVVASGLVARTGWFHRPGRAARDDVDHALGAVGLLDRRRDRVGDLSGGQQQRVHIARALVSGPELLVLDEPVAGVDQESQRLFRESVTHLVENHDAAVLLVSHELGAVADALDRVVVLKRRVVFDGPPSELAATGVSLGIHGDDLPRWLEDL